LKTNQWSPDYYLFDNISDRFGHSSGLINNTMIILGGMCFDFYLFEWTYFNDCFEINLDTKDCKEITLHENSDRMPSLGAQCSIEYKNQIFIFGGLNLSGRCNGLYSLKYSKKDETYTLKNKEPSGEIPSPRAGSAIAIHAHFIYISGGFDGKDVLDDLYQYDIKMNMWKHINVHLPHGLRLHSMNVRQFKEGVSLIVYGGVGKKEEDHHGDILEFKVDSAKLMKNLFRNVDYFDTLIFCLK
jgi:N-acetylneuraminic acid mutarotase